jgi:non-canonical (house-cleaning) NTP pyrophosphatase
MSGTTILRNGSKLAVYVGSSNPVKVRSVDLALQQFPEFTARVVGVLNILASSLP